MLAWVEYKKYEIRTNIYESYTLNLHIHTIPFFEKKNKLITEILKDGLSVETIKKHNIIIHGEVLDLRWSDIDLEKQTLSFLAR